MITKEHLDSLVALLARDDKETLTECLTNSVRRVAGGADVRLYELTDGTGAREFVGGNMENVRYRPPSRPEDPGRPVTAEAGFHDALVTQRVARIERAKAGNVRLVFPVRGQYATCGLLVIDCHENDHDTLYVIEALSHAWNSQQYLIDRSERDSLTGLLNRQAFGNRMRAIFGPSLAAVRDGQPVGPRCLALIDIDHFKVVNDQYGHLLGDEVLVQTARLLRGALRGYDQLFRFGGEEFLIVLAQTSLDQALGALERLRQMVEHHSFPQVGRVTVSAGIAGIDGRELPTTILDHADRALYYAKQAGRNQVATYETLIMQGLLAPAKSQSGDVELF